MAAFSTSNFTLSPLLSQSAQTAFKVRPRTAAFQTLRPALQLLYVRGDDTDLAAGDVWEGNQSAYLSTLHPPPHLT